MHPLGSDLSKLTDHELQEKHSDLVKKLSQSYRLGYGSMVGQLNMMLADYQEEQQRRNRVMMEELAKNNPKFDGTIDIS
jgi:hypothetical protein